MPPTPPALEGRSARAGAAAGAIAQLLAGDFDPAYRRRQRVLLGWLEGAGEGPLLDLGCGRGFSLNLARALGWTEPVGLDLDLAALSEARRSGASRVVEGDGASLPFATASFDRVLASELLEHVPDDRAVLHEIHRVLRPGGWLALSVPHADYPASYDPVNALRARLGRGPRRSGPLAGIWTDHLRLYSRAELSARLSAAGFEVRELRGLTRRCLPFLHLTIYELGRRLLPRIPAAVAARLDRSRPQLQAPNGLAPLRALVDHFDLGADSGEPVGTKAVNLALLAKRA